MVALTAGRSKGKEKCRIFHPALSVSQNYVLRHGNRFVRSRLMSKSSAFRHSRIYRRKIRGTCPRIFRIFIEIGLRPKSLIDFCNSLNAGLFILHFRFCRFLYSFGKRFLIVAYLHGLGKIIALQKVTAVRGGKLKLFLGFNSLAKQFDI